MEIYRLKAGYTLTVTTDDLTDADYELVQDNDNAGDFPTNIGYGSSVSIGPFTNDRTYGITLRGFGYTTAIAFVSESSDISGLQTQINAKQAQLSGEEIATATVAADDKILLQDTSDSDNLKTVTAQSIADLVVDSESAATLQSNIDDLTGGLSTEISRAEAAEGAIAGNLATETSRAEGVEATWVHLTGTQSAFQSDLADDADGATIATFVNGLKAALITAGIMLAS